MDVQYTAQGESGKQCKDCSMYKQDPSKPECGDCFGHQVLAAGSCNMFKAKE